ncbi:hypothetical protein [Vibrio furnissii]|uniref:hypothetical protein n=1 Tax=Vibrio furnissii TaxID=29494 RepID=UPI002573753D|nr:hypothetical protein [Vibrio furnissii]WJG24302.1 hypothetical protein QSU95_17640 [Vibrio furnissii]
MDENSNLINQRISGENHQIAGRDYITNVNPSEPEFDDGNPYKTNCPQCGRTTGRFSTSCKNCDFPVKAHFDAVEAEKQKQLKRERLDALSLKGTLALYGGLLSYGAFHWFDIANFYTLGISSGSFLSGLLILKYVSTNQQA